MGWTPRQLDEVTIWEFTTAWQAWRGFHAVDPDEDKAPEMSDERLAELGIVGFGNPRGNGDGRDY